MKNNKSFDFPLLSIIILFMIISCLFIYSAQKELPYSDNFALKQAIWYLVGFSVWSTVYFLDFEQIQKIALPVYVIGIILLFFLILAPSAIAPTIKGAKAWFVIPGFGSFQPAEFMKIFLILLLAEKIKVHNEKHVNRTFNTDLILLIKVIFITLIPLGLILMQPDAGTAMVVMTIMIGMLFGAGINGLLFLFFILLILITVSILTYIYIKSPEILLLFLDRYQLERINSWLDPFQYKSGIGYQLYQSLLAVGSGTLNGKGYYEGTVYVPEAHSDFIFTIISEEYGFWGATFVLTLYFLIIYRIVFIALENKGQFESLIAIGVISMLTFHIFENVGMVIGLVPITGIPLPLLSYGGSSVLATLLGLTLILNISAKTRKYMFSNKE